MKYKSLSVTPFAKHWHGSLSSMYNRRRFLALVGTCAGLLSASCRVDLPFSKTESKNLDAAQAQSASDAKPLAKAAELVKIKEKWTADNLYEFLNALPNESLLSLKKALGLVNEKAGLDSLYGKSKDVREIQKQALWISSNIFAYPFRDEAVLNYHALVTWVAQDIEVASDLIANESTFILERAIQTQLFAKLWDKLTVPQRKELLDKIVDSNSNISEYNGKIVNSTAINKVATMALDTAIVATFTSAGAIAALSTTVAFTGFTFYTTMSVMISTVAGFFGLTLPFAAYAGASSIVAFLSGPVGWAIMGIAAVGGVALAGRANVKKTTAFLWQVHALKVAALIEAGIPETEVFGK